MFLEPEMEEYTDKFLDTVDEADLFDDEWIIKMATVFGLKPVCDAPNDLNLVRTLAEFDIDLDMFLKDNWVEINMVDVLKDKFPKDKGKMFLLFILLRFNERFLLPMGVEVSFDFLENTMLAYGVSLGERRIYDLLEKKSHKLKDTIFDEYMTMVLKS